MRFVRPTGNIISIIKGSSQRFGDTNTIIWLLKLYFPFKYFLENDEISNAYLRSNDKYIF